MLINGTTLDMEVDTGAALPLSYRNQKEKPFSLVIAGEGPSLLGRNWLNHITLNWKKVFAVQTLRLESLNKLMQRHKSL